MDEMKTWPEFTIEEILPEHPLFAEWLKAKNPEWESEYSGHVWRELLAWEAGFEAGRMSQGV
jgi:hypothetical protein